MSAPKQDRCDMCGEIWRSASCCYHDTYSQADGDGAGMQPNFDADECDCLLCKPDLDIPQPAEFAAVPDDADGTYLDGYALGWQHGYEDALAAAASPFQVYKPLMPKRALVNGFLLASIFWIVAGLFFTSCHAQVPSVAAGSGAFNYGYISDSARVELEQAWDSRNAFQVERGYCIEPADVQVDTATDHSAIAWRVHHVQPPASVVFATPYAIEFHCGEKAIASIHIHTPTTCLHDPADPLGVHPKVCILGGDDSALCSVDEADRMAAQHDTFMVVQCDRRAFVFYWAGRRG